MEEAWEKLSFRFLLSFPADYGRFVVMYIQKENEFEPEFTKCKSGITSLKKFSISDVVNIDPAMKKSFIKEYKKNEIWDSKKHGTGPLTGDY